MLYDRCPASVEHPHTMILYYQLKLQEICKTGKGTIYIVSRYYEITH